MSDKIKASETAIVLIEYQNDFTTEGGHLHGAVQRVMEKTNMLQNTLDLVEEARKKGVQIIHSPILFSGDYKELVQPAYGILKGVVDSKSFVQGTWGGEIVDSLKPKEGDVIVKNKKVLDAFHNTDLESILKEKGVKNIAIGGFLTNCCVDSTMRTGYEKGYNVFTLVDCTAASSEIEQQVAVEKSYPMFSHPVDHKSFLNLVH